MRAWLRGRGAKSDAIAVRGITPAMIDEAATATEGFSGRELAKMVASMQVRNPGNLPPMHFHVGMCLDCGWVRFTTMRLVSVRQGWGRG